MHRNLRAEMARGSITMGDIAEFLDVRTATVSDKKSGKYRFYYDEAVAIKNHFFKELEVEYLFKRSEEKEKEGVT